MPFFFLHAIEAAITLIRWLFSISLRNISAADISFWLRRVFSIDAENIFTLMTPYFRIFCEGPMITLDYADYADEVDFDGQRLIRQPDAVARGRWYWWCRWNSGDFQIIVWGKEYYFVADADDFIVPPPIRRCAIFAIDVPKYFLDVDAGFRHFRHFHL